MRRLYWKIFLSFWGALLLFTVATVLIAALYIEHLRDAETRPDPHRIMQHIRAAQHIAYVHGREGLTRWLRELDQREAIPFFLIDENNEELLGRPVPDWFLHRAGRLRGYDTLRPAPPRRHRAAVIRLPDGTRFRLLPNFEHLTLHRILTRPRVIALPLIIAAFVSGIVCFFLARYLTAPLARLRGAAERLGAGRFDVHTAAGLGRRRDEIAELAEAFDDMAARLSRSMEAQKRLLSDASHELRSPLARLQAAIGLARQRDPSQLANELDRMERETDRLNDIVGNLLELARLRAAATALQTEPVDIVKLVESVAADADFEATTQGKRVRLSPHEPIVLEVDAARLLSAVENVVRNGIHHTAPGTTVDIDLVSSAEHAEIRIRDHGPGVPAEMLQRVFEPFVRVSEARERDSGGYGLGLAIAQQAVRLHGGTIAAENADPGLCVTITLPLRTT